MAFDAFSHVRKQYSAIGYQLEMKYSVCIFVICVGKYRLLLLVTHGRCGPQLLWSLPPQLLSILVWVEIR